MAADIESAANSTPFRSAYSLRSRYLAVTALVTVLILAGALFAQSYVERAGEMRTKHLQLRNEAVIHIRQLRYAMLEVEKSLDAFLWQATPEQRARVYQAIDRAIAEQQHLYRLDWFTTSNIASEMDDFGSDLHGLRISIDQLMHERLDPAAQDPYLAIQANSLQPATRDFNSAVTAALQHLERDESRQLRPALHHPLEELRSEWMQIDIQAESYSGITAGPHSDSPDDFKMLEQRHQALLATLDHLEGYFSPLASSSALRQDWQKIRDSSNRWSSGFDHLRLLVRKGEQRRDIHFLVNDIEPQINHIWSYIQKLDEKLEGLANDDVAEMAKAATSLAHALWLLAFIGLALLLTGLIYFERSILSPIVMVARALRNEARGHKTMSLPPAQSAETHHLIDAFSQMRHQVQQHQQSLEYLALHDSLTGLANREQLVRTIESELHSSANAATPLAVLSIALDRFREINISLGHAVGDQLLRAITERLSGCDFSQRLVARLGGDEFALLLSGTTVSEADTIAYAVIKALEPPFAVAGQSLFIAASVGIAMAPEHASNALELLQKADVATHVAKRQRNCVVYYNSEHDRHALRRLGLANALRLALDGNDAGLMLVYQPQVDIFNGKFTGVEVLLRWQHPQEGDIGPDELIPIAEHTGLIYQLTPWVLERAFAEFAHWQSLAEKPRLAINLSVFNLYDDEFPARLERLMEKWQVAPATLQLEITESAMMADPMLAQRTLSHINNMGVELTIDDFGTGFSSLTYLKHLPVSKLKIDKSFVMSMLESDNDAVIIRSTIDMAHNLGLKVVAEGVENSDTLSLLDILGCDVAQGFYFSHPLELAELTRWAEQYKAAKYKLGDLAPQRAQPLHP